MLQPLQRAAHAFRLLKFPSASLPSPASGLPGYLRAFTAEAAPFEGAKSSKDVIESGAVQQPAESAEPVSQAYAKLIDSIFGQAVQKSQSQGPEHFLNEAFHSRKRQDLAEAVDARDDAPPPDTAPHITRALDALHHHLKDVQDSPDGRRVRENWRRQILLETRAVDAALNRYENDSRPGRAGPALAPSRKLLSQWFVPLKNALEEEQKQIVEGQHGVDRSIYGPYLICMDADQLAVIVIHCVLNAFMTPESDAEAMGSSPGSARMTKLAISIGKAVESQNHINRLQQWSRERNSKYNKVVKTAYAKGHLLRQIYEASGQLSDEQWKEWKELGKKLQDENELLALDYRDWFKEGDESATKAANKRLTRMVRRVKGRETPSGKELKYVTERAKRLLGDVPGDVDWRSDIQAKIGVVLIKIMMDTLRIDVRKDGKHESVPAFWHQLQQGPDNKSRGLWKRYGLLYAHPRVMEGIKPHHMIEAFMPQFLPMVIPPVPWTRYNVGGHLTIRSGVMRMRSTFSQRDKLQKADREMMEGRGDGLSKVYDALNALGSTAWTMNPDIYEVVERIWAWGGGICDIPCRTDAPVPKVLSPGFKLQSTAPGTLALFAYAPYEVRQSKYYNSRAKKKNNELHSLRCDMEYKLAVAREFIKEERFYYPHNVDFRGRAYPMHPTLNHLGSDMCRGMLQFANERPLGPDGLRWLYIQAANLWGQGVDKLPLQGRAKWAEENLGALLDNVTEPFRRHSGGGGGPEDNGSDLIHSMMVGLEDKVTPRWYRADSPFQFLATCQDIFRALGTGDPASYRSRLPVHQDGSCNGLQHYAALARDLTGGWAVNLCPVERPQDVYTEIARLVEKRVNADASAGLPEAITLRDSTEIDRKLVKQTVMTSVYGVTFVGARAQISNRLRERGFEDNTSMYKVSCYTARVTLMCLDEMFQSAKCIMNWLSECARLIANKDRTVEWTTPLGLPVVQPYRRKTHQHVRTVLQRLVIANSDEVKSVMKQRQRTAFPPNFIHSIDSSHMMMTAIKSRNAGLEFAGVHDSFWTHASTVNEMNRLLREAFIELHSQPLLENLLNELNANYPEISQPPKKSEEDADDDAGGEMSEGPKHIGFPPVPQLGVLNLDDVQGADYFFS